MKSKVVYLIYLDNGRSYSDNVEYPLLVCLTKDKADAKLEEIQNWLKLYKDKYEKDSDIFWDTWEGGAGWEFAVANPPPFWGGKDWEKDLKEWGLRFDVSYASAHIVEVPVI